LVMEGGRPGEVYNIGGHNERTNIGIVRTIIGYLHDHADPEITEDLIRFVADRKGHDRRYGIDPTKISGTLGWHPETSFEEGIAKTIQWYLDHKAWMEEIGERRDLTLNA
ncbi:MAG TPA: GDP-mannose 4,6-dehydratase, partial [Bacillota bacterium]|nr:GDP-mannose 4,6-dehydratase [Bacillota bacterium]